MPQTTRLAIIAHDGKKADRVGFAGFNRDRLAEFELVATSSTGKLLVDKVGLEVECLESGPVGGDVQNAKRVVEGQVDAVIFMVDPHAQHPPAPDSQTLLRICNVCNVPLATNSATADALIGSPLLTVLRAARQALTGLGVQMGHSLPRPGTLVITMVPPTAAARSRMERKPR